MNILYSILLNIALILFGYLTLGSLNTSIILSKKIKHDDIRYHNSKNAGATNSLRTYGTKFAVLILIIDVFKTAIPVIILSSIFYHVLPVHEFVQNKYFVSPQSFGLGVVLGHIFPIYYKFKGGKGVACSIGVIISVNILIFLIAFIAFVLIVKISKYVSLASILTAAILLIFFWMPWMISGILGFWFNNVQLSHQFIEMVPYWYVTPIIYTIIAALVISSHHSNITKLINHTESKFSVKNKANNCAENKQNE
ncbi:glycerol-3-phosphate 1-O-acyltransferase PlsY [Mycoplasmopsis primatum]|uniref:glycerol-3-phosphate 1-O-acyltransferase PlsY n=1 Tax=Mycoplasmopsis primatum TaxID=55604 RepID=UPI00068F9E90|nr:glycerol-3-phosphate 1-O-acyltransferase PlsY [Mycoplasmopsis primatum]